MAKRTSTHEDADVEKFVADEFLSIDCGTLLQYIQDNFNPDEIFDKGELDEWAEENGYVKK